MSDLISRQDAIEAVRKVWCDNDDRKDFKQRYYEMGNNDAVEDAIGYIDALPSAEPETKCIAQIRIDRDDMKDLVNEAANEIVDKMEEPKAWWIPVSERLPEEYAQYLVCFKTGHCYVYWLEDSDWARGMAEKEGIIAWMPLPEPYKEESE